MAGGGGGGGTPSSKLRRAAKKILQTTCASFSRRQPHGDPHVLDTTTVTITSNASNNYLKPRNSINSNKIVVETASGATTDTPSSTKIMCAICLDPLSYGTGTSPGQAIFTAQCSHAFHFACISSNVRHGSVTCPICRAHWTQLPRNLNPPCPLSCNRADPVLQILDDSIASFRVHRRSFLQSARYDDDDPVEPDHTPNNPRLHLALTPVPLGHSNFNVQVTRPNSIHSQGLPSLRHLIASTSCSVSNTRAYLSVSISHQQATDLVLVASPNGPHLRLIKQAMALVVFSLRPIDRLAIVTYSSSAARVFPLKRMTAYGKRTALQVIDRLFYMGQADPIEGLKKGIKILVDRAHKNPKSCILHLSDSPTTSYHCDNMEVPIPIPVHRFHVGFGFGTSNGFVMHEFEDFLARVLGGVIREIQLRIGDESRIVRLGDLRGGEERRIPVNLGDYGHVCVEYSYVEGGVDDECIRTGEILVAIEDKREITGGSEAATTIAGRTSSVESWDYHDPYMARRWAKHLHGYRL